MDHALGAVKAGRVIVYIASYWISMDHGLDHNDDNFSHHCLILQLSPHSSLTFSVKLQLGGSGGGITVSGGLSIKMLGLPQIPSKAWEVRKSNSDSVNVCHPCIAKLCCVVL